jgi:hypothetical protein
MGYVFVLLAAVLWGVLGPVSRVALANSTVVAMGALGVVTATRPADWLAQLIGWRSMFDLLALVTFVVALFIFFSVPKEGDRSRSSAQETFANQLRVLVRIAADPVFWRVGPMVAAMSGTFIAVQTLWAGRWLADVSGLPRTVVVSSSELRQALEEPLHNIIDAVRSTLDQTPPELAGDIMDRGIVLTGGGAMLRGLDERLRHETGMPVHVAEDPLSSVAYGAGKCVEEFEALQQVLVSDVRRF